MKKWCPMCIEASNSSHLLAPLEPVHVRLNFNSSFQHIEVSPKASLRLKKEKKIRRIETGTFLDISDFPIQQSAP